MSPYDDELERAREEEHPGGSNLESLLVTETIRDALAHPPLILDTEAPVADAIELMREHRRGCVLLVRDGKLAGIFTERDVLMRLAGQAIDLDKAKVSNYMTPEPVSLPADASVAFALNKMVLEGFRHIPLVDDDGRPTGVVSMRELIEYLSEYLRKELLTLPPDPRQVPRSRDGA